MDFSALIRDPEKVYEALSLQKDGSVVCRKPVKVIIPTRYLESSLAEIGATVSTLAVYAIVVDDKYYAVSKTLAMMTLTPTSIATRKHDDTSYEELLMDAGSVFTPTTDLVVTDTLVYYVLENFVSRGRVPWFLDYEDIVTLTYSAEKHANVNLTSSHAVLAIIAAAIARDVNDNRKYFRQTLVGAEEKRGRNGKDVTFVPLSSVIMGATNTTSRLQGSHRTDGTISALINPSTRLERVEQLLRM